MPDDAAPFERGPKLRLRAWPLLHFSAPPLAPRSYDPDWSCPRPRPTGPAKDPGLMTRQPQTVKQVQIPADLAEGSSEIAEEA